MEPGQFRLEERKHFLFRARKDVCEPRRSDRGDMGTVLRLRGTSSRSVVVKLHPQVLLLLSP